MYKDKKKQQIADYLLSNKYRIFFSRISNRPYLTVFERTTAMFTIALAMETDQLKKIEKIHGYVDTIDLEDKFVVDTILYLISDIGYHGNFIRAIPYIAISDKEKIQILWTFYEKRTLIAAKAEIVLMILRIDRTDKDALKKLNVLLKTEDLPGDLKFRLYRFTKTRNLSEKVFDVEKSIKSIKDSAEESSEDNITKKIMPEIKVLEKQVSEIKNSLTDYKDIPLQFEALESFTKQSFKDLKAWRESQNVYLSDDRKEDIKELVSITNTRIDDINTTMDRDKRTMQIWLGILTALVTILLAFVAIVLPLLLNNLSNRIEESITIIWFITRILFN